MHIRWRGLELPSEVTCEAATRTSTYGKFIAEPFERGFGSTIGNGLRRVLLSSLEGSAVTRVKIQGVQHEISTIPGVVEDVTDIILNIKSLIVKNVSDQTKIIKIDRHEKGVVKGADVITDEAVEIVNPEHVIATLTADVPFVIEMTVENGRGYRTAEENAGRDRELGVIPVDSSFSPVTRIKMDIEETRVGQKTNYDKLVMEIWTNDEASYEGELVSFGPIWSWPKPVQTPHPPILQRIRRHILRHHRARSDVGVRADLHRRNQRRVGADERAGDVGAPAGRVDPQVGADVLHDPAVAVRRQRRPADLACQQGPRTPCSWGCWGCTAPCTPIMP